MKPKIIYIATINSYCGGAIALTTLCATLRKNGYDARLLFVPYFPNKEVSNWKYKFDWISYNLKNKIKLFIKLILSYFFPNSNFAKNYRSNAKLTNIDGLKVQYWPFLKEDAIVIYSEDVYGNPLGIQNVVRWLLYYYDYAYNSNAFQQTDLFIAYREVFNDLQLNPNKYIVKITYFNDKLYRRYNWGRREGCCYIIEKGANRDDLPERFDGPILYKSMRQEDFVDILNKCCYCYCYDPQTFYTKIAVVCGCIPIFIMEKNKTEDDYLGKDEKHYGVAYGNNIEQIEYAINTRDLCLSELDYTESNNENVMKLIKILSSKFGNIRRIKL